MGQSTRGYPPIQIDPSHPSLFLDVQPWLRQDLFEFVARALEDVHTSPEVEDPDPDASENDIMFTGGLENPNFEW